MFNNIFLSITHVECSNFRFQFNIDTKNVNKQTHKHMNIVPQLLLKCK